MLQSQTKTPAGFTFAFPRHASPKPKSSSKFRHLKDVHRSCENTMVTPYQESSNTALSMKNFHSKVDYFDTKHSIILGVEIQASTSDGHSTASTEPLSSDVSSDELHLPNNSTLEYITKIDDEDFFEDGYSGRFDEILNLRNSSSSLEDVTHGVGSPIYQLPNRSRPYTNHRCNIKRSHRDYCRKYAVPDERASVETVLLTRPTESPQTLNEYCQDKDSTLFSIDGSESFIFTHFNECRTLSGEKFNEQASNLTTGSLTEELGAFEPELPLDDVMASETKQEAEPILDQEIIKLIEPSLDPYHEGKMNAFLGNHLKYLNLGEKELSFIVPAIKKDFLLIPPFMIFPRQQMSLLLSKDPSNDTYTISVRSANDDSLLDLKNCKSDTTRTIEKSENTLNHYSAAMDGNHDHFENDFAIGPKNVERSVDLSSSRNVDVNDIFNDSGCTSVEKGKDDRTRKVRSPKAENLVKDEDLRAVMKFTNNGNDVSVLFPSFSYESSVVSFDSDDGLKEELKALDELQRNLQKELDGADIIINGIQRKTPRTRKKLEADLWKEMENADYIIKCLQDPHHRRHCLKRNLSDSSRNLKRETKSTTGARDRRVRFAEHNEEFIFVGDGYASSSESSHDEQNFGSFVTTFEELYIALDEYMNFLGTSCARR